MCEKPVPPQAIRLSKAMGFIDTVAMDLHQLGEKLPYLHFIGEFSRLSNYCTIMKSRSKFSHKDVSKILK